VCFERDSRGSSGRLTRRQSLAVGVSSVFAGLAGCLGAPSTESANRDRPPGVPRVATRPTTDLELPVDDSALTRGAPVDAIPAIVDPAFGANWAGVSAEVPAGAAAFREPKLKTIQPRLSDDERVVGVARAGEARAYPLRVLNWHEVVNDRLGGPLLVTYCPLCRTALAARRRVDGEVTRFGVSGLLFRNDLVMYDGATGSHWSQLLATAIQGPMTGEALDLVPSTLTTLGEWRETHPDTVVLRPPPESGTVGTGLKTRDYTRDPYAGYERSDDAGLDDEFDDDRLHPKTVVLGVERSGVARAYPAETIREEALVEDVVGGLPIVVTTTGEGTPIAWHREVDGRERSFEVGDDRHLRAGGSRWRRSTGIAVDGPYEGTRLAQANAVSPLFWFAWLDFYPDTELYGPDTD